MYQHQENTIRKNCRYR